MLLSYHCQALTAQAGIPYLTGRVSRRKILKTGTQYQFPNFGRALLSLAALDIDRLLF
jgi:hypothetical protein